jgi:hypothetical protein
MIEIVEPSASGLPMAALRASRSEHLLHTPPVVSRPCDRARRHVSARADRPSRRLVACKGRVHLDVDATTRL